MIAGDGLARPFARFPEVAPERRNRPREVVGLSRERSPCGALPDVSVPAVRLGERDLESDVCLDERGDLLQPSAERR